ncbi:hypothetical protein [Photobacterium damselae]|uniref:hypothetical protein n=1 Tax=Photobacterium damselae TaxID=38293 RepID=UPI004068FA32
MTQGITLSLSIEQAQTLKHALEILMRLGLGQVQYALISALHDGTIPCSQDKDVLEDFEDVLKTHLNGVVLDGLGIFNDKIDIKTKRAYEIKKVLSQAIVEITGSGRGTVDNEGLNESLRVTKDNLPIASIIK